MDTMTFAGFDFPRHIPEFYKSTHNKRTLASGRTIPARMRFAYYHAPKPGAQAASFYLGSDFMPGLRWAWCDEVEGVRINHTGWFADSFCDDKIRGVVFRLPRGRGFLAGWSMGENMASGVDYRVHDSEKEAAWAADREAEIVAERNREAEETEEADDCDNADEEAGA